MSPENIITKYVNAFGPSTIGLVGIDMEKMDLPDSVKSQLNIASLDENEECELLIIHANTNPNLEHLTQFGCAVALTGDLSKTELRNIDSKLPVHWTNHRVYFTDPILRNAWEEASEIVASETTRPPERVWPSTLPPEEIWPEDAIENPPNGGTNLFMNGAEIEEDDDKDSPNVW